MRLRTHSKEFVACLCQTGGQVSNFTIQSLAKQTRLDDYDAAVLAINLICDGHEILRPLLVPVSQALDNIFQSLLRRIGTRQSSDDLTVDEIASLMQNLLLDSILSRVLAPVQKFVVEYAIYQRYQVDIPSELSQILQTYNKSRVADDKTKSLAQLFEETRGAATTTVSSAEQMLLRTKSFGDRADIETQVAELLIALVNSASSGSWKGESLGRALSRVYPALRWERVLRLLDSPNLYLTGPDDLHFLLDTFAAAASSGSDIPVAMLWSQWDNVRAQASLLRFLTATSPSVCSLFENLGPKVLTVDNFATASPALRHTAAALQTSPWNILELLKTSLRLLAAEEAAQDAKLFLEAAGKATPELVFLGCVQLPEPWGPQQEQLSEKGFEVFFNGQKHHEVVFYRLWQVDSKFMSLRFLEYYLKEPKNTARIVEIAQTIGILDQLMITPPLSFALDLAVAASRIGIINMEKWLEHQLTVGQVDFIEAVLRYLASKAEAENSFQQSIGHQPPSPTALRVETVAVFLKALMNTAMSPENGETLKQVQSSCLQVYPRLMNSTHANRDPTDSNSFAKDVEKEVEYYYGRLYEGEMTIATFIEMLQTLKGSPDPKDQDVFACMLHSLFDEYRFFADYPVTALNITAVLFGSLIQNQLLSYIPLGIALRYVLDAVGHEPESNMYRFGVQALNHFKDRVPDWPQYCEQILSVQTLGTNEPELMSYIRTKQHSAPSQTSDHIFPTVHRAEDNSMNDLPFRALRHSRETLRDENDREPTTEQSDKILFNINNLSQVNLSEKLDEIREVLDQSYYAWFANHIVSQRAAIEPNYHGLYIEFLQGLQDEGLINRIVLETINNIALLLNSDNSISSSIERANLKNLGSWLGSLTLARNRPLKHKLISLKDLLLEGFDCNRLIVVLPFVCRVIEQTVQSRVFKPPNPWTMAVVSLLMELYEKAEMKLNLKFEVEVLCNRLNLEISEVVPSSILTNRPAVPEYSDEDEVGAQGLQALSMGPDAEQRTSADQEYSTAFIAAAVAELPITVHPMVHQSLPIPNLREVFSVAIERAVGEFLLPVVDRSVAVASISTSQLISKDFAYEQDISKLRRAAHTMNQNLAGSLALVTCKEPLRNSLMSNSRALLAQNGFESSGDGEALLTQLVNDNLDSVCMIVEKAAKAKAANEIDEGMASSYQVRREYHESGSTQPFSDPNAPRFLYPLPDPLRLRPEGLSQEQLSTYDEFSQIPRTAHEASLYYNKDESHPSALEPIPKDYPHVNIAFEQILTGIAQIDTLARELDVTSIEDVPTDKSIHQVLASIPLHLAAMTDTMRDDRILACAQRVCQLLFGTPYHELSAQCLSLVLRDLTDSSAKTLRDVNIWLVHSEDPQKYNVSALLALMRAKVISPSEFDVQLSKDVMLGKKQAIDFAIDLIQEAVLSGNGLDIRTDFVACLEALDNTNRLEDVERIENLFVSLNSNATSPPVRSGDMDEYHLQAQIKQVIEGWVHLVEHPTASDKVQLAYIVQLQRSGLLKDQRLVQSFFRYSLEYALKSAEHSAKVSGGNSFATLDATSKLIVLLTKYNLSAGSGSVVTNFEKILCTNTLLILKERSAGQAARGQRPVVRFFVSLLAELHMHSSGLSDVMADMLLIVSQSLLTLQPQHFPEFVFGWITILSHRLFMPKLLSRASERTWPSFCQLLVALLHFIAPKLTESKLATTTRVIYQALLRILLVLLNDFPSFLDQFHHSLLNAIP